MYFLVQVCLVFRPKIHKKKTDLQMFDTRQRNELCDNFATNFKNVRIYYLLTNELQKMGIFRERFSNFLGNPSCNVLAFDFTLILTHLYIFIVLYILAHAKALVFMFQCKILIEFLRESLQLSVPSVRRKVIYISVPSFLCEKKSFMKIRKQR